MIDQSCLNAKGGKCTVLKVDSCPVGCSSRSVDPVKHFDMLLDLLTYARGNKNASAALKRQIKAHKEKFAMEDGEIKDPEIRRAYWEDTHRGGKGSHSEGNAPDVKAKMKDNRPQECKMTKTQREEIKTETEKFENEHGKLEKLSRSLLSKSKIDSYTGDEI